MTDIKKDIYHQHEATPETDRFLVSDMYSSKRYLRVDKTIAVATLLKESKGIGTLTQILFKSNNQSYSVQIIIDKEVVWDNTYAFFLANTTDIVGISAYAAGGKDYLSIQNLEFQKDFLVRIRPTASIVWDIIMIRYDIRDETILQEY